MANDITDGIELETVLQQRFDELRERWIHPESPPRYARVHTTEIVDARVYGGVREIVELFLEHSYADRVSYIDPGQKRWIRNFKRHIDERTIRFMESALAVDTEPAVNFELRLMASRHDPFSMSARIGFAEYGNGLFVPVALSIHPNFHRCFNVDSLGVEPRDYILGVGDPSTYRTVVDLEEATR